jgi:hypothetical protein
MTDPDTYIESRRIAIIKYLKEYNISHTEVGCKPWIISNIIQRKSLTMQKVDMAYRLLVEKTGEVKPVEGGHIDEWRKSIVDEMERIRKEEGERVYKFAIYIGMKSNTYRDMVNNPTECRGKSLWNKLKKLQVEPEEDMYKPKYTSIRQLWRSVS